MKELREEVVELARIVEDRDLEKTVICNIFKYNEYCIKYFVRHY